MSYELVLAAGPEDAESRRLRARRVETAAGLVPGAVPTKLVETTWVTAALVETEPSGGCAADLTLDRRDLDVVIATSSAGVRQARSAGARQLGAEFGHVRAHATGGRVTVTTDGTAFLPSYWAFHDDTLLVTTHLSSLVSLGLPATTDARGLVEYLTLLHPLQQRTLLVGASALPPGGLLTWDVGAPPKVEAQPLFLPGDRPLSDDAAVASFRELWPDVLRDVTERAAQERLLQGLSGGLDSRAIAAGLAAIGSRPLSYTYGAPPSRESASSAQVARRLGLTHVQVPVTPDRMLRGFADVSVRLDGAHSASEMYESWFGDVLRSLGDVVVNGLAGGPLWGDDKASGLTERREVEAHVWSRYARSFTSVTPFLAPSLRNEAQALLRESLSDSLEPWDFSARGDMAVFWRLSNRQLRWGNMLVNALRREGLRLETPFLDSRFLRFCASLTPEQRLNGRLYLRVHREVFAPTSGVRRSDDGNTPADLDHVYWSADRSYARQVLGLAAHHPVSAVRRVTRRCTEAGAALAGRHTFARAVQDAMDRRTSSFPASLWLRSEPVYASRLASALEAGARQSELLDGEAIAAAASALTQGAPSTDPLVLGRLATAGLWLADHDDRQRRRPD